MPPRPEAAVVARTSYVKMQHWRYAIIMRTLYEVLKAARAHEASAPDDKGLGR